MDCLSFVGVGCFAAFVSVFFGMWRQFGAARRNGHANRYAVRRGARRGTAVRCNGGSLAFGGHACVRHLGRRRGGYALVCGNQLCPLVFALARTSARRRQCIFVRRIANPVYSRCFSAAHFSAVRCNRSRRKPIFCTTSMRILPAVTNFGNRLDLQFCRYIGFIRWFG